MCAVFLFCSTVSVLANSGPVYWQGYPSAGIMAVEKNSPIKVKREDLVFDFSDWTGSDYTVSGRVTAAYKMSNPTEETQPVNMAFPFVGRASSLSAEDVTITADGVTLSYDVYFGNAMDSYKGAHGRDGESGFGFEDIVSSITDKPYRAESFEEKEKGRLYTFHVQPTIDQEVNFAVDFAFDASKTRVLTKGFNRMERDKQNTRIASWCRQPKVLEVLVLGEDINFDINAYTDGKLSQRTELLEYRIDKKEAELRPYLLELVRDYRGVKDSGIISDIQIYNLYAQALDNHFTRHMGLCSEDDLRAMGRLERIITLVYTVNFPPKSEKEVSVSYNTSGTMEGRKTSKPLYSFEYLLNPARNWADFKYLNIEVIPPQAAPYIVESSTHLTRGEDGVYKASLEALPEEDLTFTLYAFEKVTLLDRAYGSVQRRFGYMTPLVLGAAFLLAMGVAVTSAIVRRKRELMR